MHTQGCEEWRPTRSQETRAGPRAAQRTVLHEQAGQVVLRHSPVLEASQPVDLVCAVGLEGSEAAGLPQAVDLAARGPLAAHAGCLAYLVGLEVAKDPDEHLFRQHLLYQGQLPLQLAQAQRLLRERADG